MKKGLICIIAAAAVMTGNAAAQSPIVKDFQPVCDSIGTLIQERSSVKGRLRVRAVMKRGSWLDFYFTKSIGDFPWDKDSYARLKKELKGLFPEKYGKYRLGEIYCERTRLDKLIVSPAGNDGEPSETPFRVKDRRSEYYPLVRNAAMPEFTEGLYGRHIALWASHGLYYDQQSSRWRWQRPRLFRTVEDMLTPGFVLPFLVPMLENAGCCVMMPRERDVNPYESICDNDPHFETPPSPGMRTSGHYEETGRWESAGSGFADTMPVYYGNVNPFETGTSRMTPSIPEGRQNAKKAAAVWTPDIPERGEYAVYVSYKTLPNSTESASYTVRHAGGESRFVVNQTMGGGTWVYVGTFTFDKGTDGSVVLDNAVPRGRKFVPGKVVTADAVKVGGGMGNIARKDCSDGEASPETSGMPRFTEGARYWLQWAGADSSVYSQNENLNDYMDDFMSRGMWVQELSGGSVFNRKGKGRKIPVDMAFALHTDAGIAPEDSTIGTLGIYTLQCDGVSRYPDGSSRMSARELTDFIQSHVVDNIRARHDTLWNRRQIWDRSYSESRTTGTPAVLLELLSHQNFADMKHGLDPAFRFTVSRAIYTGILKYLSNRYGCPYTVQPLPVNSFAVRFGTPKGSRMKAELSWKDTADSLEPTAVPESYILYTKIDGGAFDGGIFLKDIRRSKGRVYAETDILPGHIYSFSIAPCNAGGIGFRSETLSIGMPEKAHADSAVAIVNNFDRVSPPLWFDTPSYAGFDDGTDSGVPYIEDRSFIGEMYMNRRQAVWMSDDNPGFGASYSDYAGKALAGNTFDYPYTHGKAVMENGYPFFSVSGKAFAEDSVFRKSAWCADIICGKQSTTPSGNGKYRYEVFSAKMQESISSFAESGGDILVSGSYIGTDVWDGVFPVQKDSAQREAGIKFAEKVLGYRWAGGHASAIGKVVPVASYKSGFPGEIPEFSYSNKKNSTIYCVESPDGIAPAGKDSKVFIRYADSGIAAGICCEKENYRTVCMGVPLETILQENALKEMISSALKFFSK